MLDNGKLDVNVPKTTIPKNSGNAVHADISADCLSGLSK
jgi:hypothetical protein